jgi:hypothetical protein
MTVALPLVISLAVMAYAWPASRIAPRDLPVGIVGTSAASQNAVEGLAHSKPGGFDFHLYPDEASARSAIKNREVYGAFVVLGLAAVALGRRTPTVADGSSVEDPDRADDMGTESPAASETGTPAWRSTPDGYSQSPSPALEGNHPHSHARHAADCETDRDGNLSPSPSRCGLASRRSGRTAAPQANVAQARRLLRGKI